MAEYTQEQREQAARALEAERDWHEEQLELWSDLRDAFDTAIACLRSPIASPDVDGKAGGWVRTSERKMTLADADDDGMLPVIVRNKKTKEVKRAYHHVYDKFDLMGWEDIAFLPLPALPEVSE